MTEHQPPSPEQKPDVPHPRRVRSFVRRAGRVTTGQAKAHAELGGQFLLPFQQAALDFSAAFGREAPAVLEIGFDDLVRIHVRGQGQLHQDAVHAGVVVQGVHAGEQIALGHRGGVALQRGFQACLAAVVDLVFDVHLAGGVFAHQDDGQVRFNAAGFEGLNAVGHVGADLAGQRVAVDELCSHGQIL